MAQQTLDLSTPNDGLGTPLRTGGDMINDNFDELYADKHVHGNSSVLDATTASFTTADETKLDYLSVTGAVDLDDVAASVVITVDLISDLTAVSPAPATGTLYRVLGYVSVNDGGGGIFEYDSAASDTIDNALVFDGPGSVGRWLRRMHGVNVITPEMFGCDGTGATDNTTELQAFVDFFDTLANAKKYSGRGLGCYKITDTLLFDSLNNYDIAIGKTGLDKSNGWLFQPPSGVLYAGTGGTGYEPEDCKPAVRIKVCNNGRLSLVVHQDKTDTPADYTTGILISSDGTSQYGEVICDHLEAYNFTRGIVAGLYDHTGGVVGNTNNTEDVLESWKINKIRIAGCLYPLFMSCPASDGTTIQSLEVSGYRPTFTSDADFGKPCPTVVHMENAGTVVIDSMWAASMWMGQSHIQVTAANVNDSTDTLTYNSHGLNNGDTVHVQSASLPTGLSAATIYYVVGATTNTFQLSLTSGGAAVDITSAATQDIMVATLTGDEWTIYSESPRVTVNKLHVESPFAGVLKHAGAVTTSRGASSITNLTSSVTSYTVDGYAIDTQPPLTLVNCTFAGEVRHYSTLSTVGCHFFGDINKYVNTAATRPALSIVGVTESTTLTTAPTVGHAGSVLCRPLAYGEGTEKWLSYQRYQIPAYNVTVATTDIDTGTDVISKTNTFSDDEPVMFTTTGTLPGGIEANTRYFIANRSAGAFQIADRDGNVIDITSQGTGTHYAREAIDVCEYVLSTSYDQYALRIKLAGVGTKGTGTDNGAVGFDCDCVFMIDSEDEVAVSPVVSATSVSTGLTDIRMFGAITYDSTQTTFTISLACTNSGNNIIRSVMNADVFGIQNQFAIWPSNDWLGRVGGAGFAWL